MRFVNVAIVANIQLGIVHLNWILATTATFQRHVSHGGVLAISKGGVLY